VINVVQYQIATSLPSKIGGAFSLNGETVNTGLSGALNVKAPVSDFVLNLDLNGRYASNTQTPAGEIENSFFETTNDALGVSWIQDWGYLGGSFGTYLSRYGIPPNPDGHEDGVDIELKKFQYVLKSEYIVKGDFLNTIDADLSLKNYNHKEYETATVVGTEFGLVTTDLNLKASHNSLGFFTKGRFGLAFEVEDYAVRGASTPSSNSYNIGAYIIEETDFGALHLEGGFRFDYILRSPKETDPDNRIGDIRNRSFPALSSSVSAIYNLGKGFSLGSTLLHSFRAPSLEELFSQGPHLASYSFEIGNPELDPERGLAKELFLRYKGNTTVFEATVFHNGFSNYLYAQNTGRPNNRYPTLNDYQFVGTEASLYGFEVFGEQQITQNFLVDASITYTIGERDSAGVTSPLPQIPPFKIKGSVKYVQDGFEIGSRIRFAAEQDRTGEFETATQGYTLVDVFTQYRLSKGNLLHTFSLNFSNLLDEQYYNHLSRIKDLRPEPGRNISLLYRVFF
jgi:iron complex outermembrane receptor protein